MTIITTKGIKRDTRNIETTTNIPSENIDYIRVTLTWEQKEEEFERNKIEYLH